jgi:hypothetical protein
LLSGKSLIKNIAGENYLQSYDEKENSISFGSLGQQLRFLRLGHM